MGCDRSVPKGEAADTRFGVGRLRGAETIASRPTVRRGTAGARGEARARCTECVGRGRQTRRDGGPRQPLGERGALLGAAAWVARPPGPARAPAMAQAAPAPDRTHSFAKKTFHKPTYCHHCSDLLWGLIGQGYGCEGTRRACAPSASRYRLHAPPCCTTSDPRVMQPGPGSGPRRGRPRGRAPGSEPPPPLRYDTRRWALHLKFQGRFGFVVMCLRISWVGGWTWVRITRCCDPKFKVWWVRWKSSLLGSARCVRLGELSALMVETSKCLGSKCLYRSICFIRAFCMERAGRAGRGAALHPPIAYLPLAFSWILWIHYSATR